VRWTEDRRDGKGVDEVPQPPGDAAGRYAELFGAEDTLKVNLHYWRDGVVKYIEFPQDSALDLTGR